MEPTTILLLIASTLNLFGIVFLIYKISSLEKKIEKMESDIKEMRLHTKKIIEILNVVVKRINSNPISFN